MILSEPGSRIEGPTEDILAAIYWAIRQHGIQSDRLKPREAEARALSVLPRIHYALTVGKGGGTAGWIVRDINDDDPGPALPVVS